MPSFGSAQNAPGARRAAGPVSAATRAKRFALKVEFSRRADGSGVLRCTRADDSVTWEKRAKYADFFALHDLTHFAVESELGFQRGFFGLIAEGWDIEDTTGKGKRGPLPPEAGVVEQLVGAFDREQHWPLNEFNKLVDPRVLSEDDVQRVRALKSRLAERLFALDFKCALELEFVAGMPISAL